MAGTNRTKIIQDLAVDVTTLKKEFVEQSNKIEHIATWIKDNWKPTLDEMKDKFGTEVESLKEGIDASSKMGKNLATWVKDNLGTKMERLNEYITAEVSKQLSIREKQMKDEQKERDEALWQIFNAKNNQQQQSMNEYIEKLEKEKDEAKIREAALWNIFNKKFSEQEQAFEEYMQAMADDKNNSVKADMKLKREIIEEQEKTVQELIKMQKVLEQMEEERKKMEELKKQIEKSYEELMTEAKKRPEAEAEMFKRVTRKLDAERTLLATDRQKMESELKKLVEWEEKRKIHEEVKLEKERLKNKWQLEEKAKTEYKPALDDSDLKVQKLKERQAVNDWLTANGLGQYYQKFIDCGYESLSICALIDDSELVAMDINKLGHRKALLQACQRLRDNASPKATTSSMDTKWKDNEFSRDMEEKEKLNESVERPSLGLSTETETTPIKLPQVKKERNLPPIPQNPGSGPISEFSPNDDTESSDTVFSESEEDIFANK